MAMTAATAPDTAVPVDTDVELKHPVSVNIKAILDSVAGKLTDDELDQWFFDLEKANEDRGLHLEMTCDGELIISPMVNRGGGMAEGRFFVALAVWAETNGGEAYAANANMRLPDGSRMRPDALWLSQEQVSALPPVAEDKPITVCPAFVAEIVSGTDTLPPLQRKMDIYIANGALLGWLIDPYRKQVHVYRPDADVEVLDDPESISGDPIMPGFMFQVRERIFSLHEPAGT